MVIEREFEYHANMSTSVYVPPGWPSQVRPPGASGWEATAIAYLLDCCPPDFAPIACCATIPSCWRSSPPTLSTASTKRHKGTGRGSHQPGEYVEADVVEAATQAWLEQGARLARTRRAVALVEEALRGRVFVRKL